MTEAEKVFLAFAAIGVFRVDADGAIWKTRRLIAGSTKGTPPYWRDIPTQRAETSTSDGYPTVMFSDGARRHKVFAHRVVWMVTNQSDIPLGLQVNHKNGKRGDTRPENLETCTPSENVIHAIRVLGRQASPLAGEKNPAATLTAEQVRKIRALGGKMAQSQIAKLFNTKQQTVSNILQRRSWKHLP
jgi:hypothetical protein